MVGALARLIVPGFGQRPAAALAGEAKASAATIVAELVIIVFIMADILLVLQNWPPRGWLCWARVLLSPGAAELRPGLAA
jgi:hypothetical protein